MGALSGASLLLATKASDDLAGTKYFFQPAMTGTLFVCVAFIFCACFALFKRRWLFSTKRSERTEEGGTVLRAAVFDEPPADHQVESSANLQGAYIYRPIKGDDLKVFMKPFELGDGDDFASNITANAATIAARAVTETKFKNLTEKTSSATKALELNLAVQVQALEAAKAQLTRQIEENAYLRNKERDNLTKLTTCEAALLATKATSGMAAAKVKKIKEEAASATQAMLAETEKAMRSAKDEASTTIRALQMKLFEQGQSLDAANAQLASQAKAYAHLQSKESEALAKLAECEGALELGMTTARAVAETKIKSIKEEAAAATRALEANNAAQAKMLQSTKEKLFSQAVSDAALVTAATAMGTKPANSEAALRFKVSVLQSEGRKKDDQMVLYQQELAVLNKTLKDNTCCGCQPTTPTSLPPAVLPCSDAERRNGTRI